MVEQFRYALLLESGESADPAVFVSDRPPMMWIAGDEFTTPGGRSFRILVVLPSSEDAMELLTHFDGVWTVIPV